MHIILFFAQLVFAIEPTNPIALCERFIAPENKKACEKKIQKIGPDWYLASVCEKQFDDAQFYTCIEMSQKYNFTPTALEKCTDPGFSDQQRLSCLQTISGNIAFQDQNKEPVQKLQNKKLRLPASGKKK